MAHDLASLRASPNSLAPHYTAFRVAERLLFTGHSHQAWPDCARDGLLLCFDDAALAVDDKWGRAFERAERVRAGFAALLADDTGQIALGASTHELVVRFLSALPLKARPRLVTTDSEFHSLRRQLERLGEEGLEVVRVPAAPVTTLAERLIDSLAMAPERTAAVLVSSVLFTTAEIVPELASLASACEQRGAALLIDSYHQLGVVPFSMRGLERAFVVGGGYKYLQLGEGNCFLRFPRDSQHRPVVTGWFAEFAWLDASERPGPVPYGAGPARFAGSTYDPSSHYRASAVLDFFAREGLTPELLRALSQHQLARLFQGFDALALPPALVRAASSTPLSGLGGFLALRTPFAARLSGELARRGVAVDQRGEIVRLGPAPYLSDAQLDRAIEALAESLRALSGA